MKNDMITGTVRTNKVGSDSEFEICSREDWEALTDDEKERLVLEAMWESGLVEVSVNE